VFVGSGKERQMVDGTIGAKRWFSIAVRSC
jgi:hypothetical protein